MEGRLTVIVAVATVVGVVLGATVDSFLSKDIEFSRQLMRVRMDTYKEYVTVQSQFASAVGEEKAAINKRIDQNHKQIAVFGSAAAIENLAKFADTHNRTLKSRTCAAPTTAFLDSVMQMRKDLGIDQPTDSGGTSFFNLFRSMAGNFGIEGAGAPPEWQDLAVLMWGCGKK